MMFVLSLALLTACGGKQETSPSGGGSNAAPNTKSDAQNSGAAQVKIEYFQMKNEVVDVVNRLIEKFESEHPGIDVEQNNVPNPENVWSIRLSTNDAPDVFTHYPHNAVFRELVKEGRVVDLTQDPLLADINPAIVDLSKIDGNNYLVPIALATMGVYYNVDLFHELHLDIPQTYDELIQTAEKLKAAGFGSGRGLRSKMGDEDRMVIGKISEIRWGAIVKGLKTGLRSDESGNGGIHRIPSQNGSNRSDVGLHQKRGSEISPNTCPNRGGMICFM